MFFDPLKRRRRRQDLYLLRDLYFLRPLYVCLFILLMKRHVSGVNSTIFILLTLFSFCLFPVCIIVAFSLSVLRGIRRCIFLNVL